MSQRLKGAKPENFSSVKQAAKEYARRGWVPIRLHPEEKRPVEKGWPDTTVDGDETFAQFRDDSNIGIILGPKSDGLVDVDCDCPEAVAAAVHLLPDTAMVHGRDSSRSSHFWYRCKEADKTQRFRGVEAETLIELRSSTATSASFTMVPPSTHPEGEELVWEGLLAPAEVDAEVLSKSVRRVAAAALIAKVWISGGRHDLALALAGYLARGGYTQDEAELLVRAVCAAANDEDIQDRLNAVETTYGNFTSGQPVTGAKTLLDLVGEQVMGLLVKWLGVHAVPVEHLVSSPQDTSTDDLAEYSETWNALYFVERDGEDVRYATSAWGWHFYDGKRWSEDVDSAYVKRKIQAAALSMAVRAQNFPNKELLKWARNSQNRRVVDNTEALARLDERVRCHPEDFDRLPHLLNVENGTIDLRTGDLSPHRHEDMITKLLPVSYSREAQCPMFADFLRTIFADDEELIRFMQKTLGHALLGANPEQLLFILYGHGANGKSVLVNTILDIIGSDFAQQLNPETLLERRSVGAPRPDLAALRGIRFVSAAEMNDRSSLDVALVKSITGGDRIRARFLYSRDIEFLPQFTVFLSTNYRPYVGSQGHAIWRRLVCIPFGVTIPDEQQDPHLKDKLLEEKEGILAWLVEGCVLYHNEGLVIPESVRAATTEYKEDMDTLGAFLRECTEEAPGEFIRSSDLYQRYKDWCEDSGFRPLNNKNLKRQLEQRGLQWRRNSGGVRWLDYTLKSDDEPMTPEFDTDVTNDDEVSEDDFAMAYVEGTV